MRDCLIHVCVTCKREGDDPLAPRQGRRLHESLLQEAPSSVTLVPVECLGNCKRSCTVSMAAPAAAGLPASWTYVFGDLVAESAGDVLTAAALLANSTDGLMPWRGRPEPFKRGMIARIPPHMPLKEAAE